MYVMLQSYVHVCVISEHYSLTERPRLHANLLQKMIQRQITRCGTDTENLYFDKSSASTRAHVGI
jgi:hypothetical protein